MRPTRRLGRGGAAIVLALAASAAANYLLAKRAERRNPPQGRFLTLNGVRLHYLDRGPREHSPAEHGSEPAVVLLHGVGAMSREMVVSGLIDALAVDHRVIAFDRPGFGYSERPRTRIWTPAAQAALLRDALDRLGVARPVIVGHSWGTMVALEMGLRDPDRTAGLVLLSGYFFPTFRFDVPLLFWPAVPLVGDVLRYTISPWFSRLSMPLICRWLFAPAPVMPSFAAGFPSELTVRPWQLRATAAEIALLIPAAAALAGRYAGLSMPVAIAAGAADRVIDFGRHSARLHKTLPGSTLHEITGTGHMVHHSAPGRIAALIRDTVRATQPAPALSGR